MNICAPGKQPVGHFVTATFISPGTNFSICAYQPSGAPYEPVNPERKQNENHKKGAKIVRAFDNLQQDINTVPSNVIKYLSIPTTAPD